MRTTCEVDYSPHRNHRKTLSHVSIEEIVIANRFGFAPIILSSSQGFETGLARCRWKAIPIPWAVRVNALGGIKARVIVSSCAL